MTGKEAIAMLKRMQEPEAGESQINEAAFEALEMAIKALETQDRQAIIAGSYLLEGKDNVPDTNVGDIISRQWLMECVNEGWIKFDTEEDENRFIHLVRDIAPSAQPNTIPLDWIQRYADDWENMNYAYENPILGMLEDWMREQDE